MLTVVADDVDLHVLILRRHRCLSDLSVHLGPQVLIPVERHAADRAPQRLQTSKRHLQLPQTLLVDGVAALQNRDLHRGLEQVLQANRAILMHGLLHASVRAPYLVRIATPTSVAMEEFVPASHATYATTAAMEDLLLDPLVIPEVALSAEVRSEDLPTRHATLPRPLRGLAVMADDLSDPCPVDLVLSRLAPLSLVVAVAAPEVRPAAWRHDAAAPPVVAATRGAFPDEAGAAGRAAAS